MSELIYQVQRRFQYLIYCWREPLSHSDIRSLEIKGKEDSTAYVWYMYGIRLSSGGPTSN